MAAGDPIALFDAGKFEEAKKVLLDLEKEKPNDPMIMYYLGRVIEDNIRSRRLFARLLKQYPDHDLADDALLELAETDFAHPAGTYLSARDKYRQLVAQFPNSSHVAMSHYRVGLTFLAVHQPDSAIVAFDLAHGGNNQRVIDQARLGKLEAFVMRGEQKLALQQAQIWMVEGAGAVSGEVGLFVERLSDRTLPPTKNEGKFWVRVAAFGNDRNVAAMKKKLEDAKFKVSLVSRVGSRLTLVYVGPYMERQEVDKDLKRISTLTGLLCKIEERP